MASSSGILPAEHWATADKYDSSSDSESATTSLAESIYNYRTLHGRTYHSDRGEEQQYWGANDKRQSESLDIK